MSFSGVHVTVHVAQSLDGRLALRGIATPLSTLEGQRAAHLARAESDAVLVGIDTVRIDDPRLTVRHVEGRNPLRVVLASQLDVPKNARLLATTTMTTSASSSSNGSPDGGGGVLVIGARGRATDAARDALTSVGAAVATVRPTRDGMVSLPDAMEILAERGVKKLLVEGGARVLTSFFREGLVDHVEIEIAMVMIGEPGTAMFGLLGVNGLERAPRLTNVRVDRLGTSVLVRGDVTPAPVSASASSSSSSSSPSPPPRSSAS